MHQTQSKKTTGHSTRIFPISIAILAVCIPLLAGCSQQRDQRISENQIQFANQQWSIKHSDSAVGPGPNRFASDDQAVYLDDKGHLHLLLAKRGEQWYSTEIVTETPVGYGTYIYELEGRLDRLDPNVVLGLFTWDNDTFPTDANTELDIEVSRWTDPEALNLYFSVQPTRGPDVPEGKYHERYAGYMLEQTGEITTHWLHWTPQAIHFATYDGQGTHPDQLVAAWTYQPNHPPRRAPGEWAEGHNSNPVGIPRPGSDTHARINLWLVDGNADGLGDAPATDDPIEVIVRDFTYIPLED